MILAILPLDINYLNCFIFRLDVGDIVALTVCVVMLDTENPGNLVGSSYSALTFMKRRHFFICLWAEGNSNFILC